jgi:hypothetical protein
MILHSVWSFLIICVLGFLGARAARADSRNDDITIPESYPKDYIFTLFSHNEPVSRGLDKLHSHLNSLGISYQHRLGRPWVVSVGFRQQSFINAIQNRPVSIVTVFNSTQRVVRLYHPLYLLAGTEVLYLMPLQKANPPVTKDADFNTEIGAGLVASLWYLMSQNSIFSLELQRWRGTKTNQLHGVSMTVGLGWGF